MSNDRRTLKTVVRFFEKHRTTPGAWFLRFEGLITGGLIWLVKSKLTDRRLLRDTDGLFEIPDNAHSGLQKQLLAEQDCADYGVSVGESLRDTIEELERQGIPPAKIRTWIISEHISSDGELHAGRQRNPLLWSLGWTWHLIVVVTAVLFLALTWTLPGPIWKKAVVSAIEILFFLIMAALMNSRSLSTLPPNHPT